MKIFQTTVYHIPKLGVDVIVNKLDQNIQKNVQDEVQGFLENVKAFAI